MPEKPASLSPADAVLRSWEIHSRIHLYLLDRLAEAVWDAPPPDGKGRTLAALVSHIHGVRLMWIKAGGEKALPAPLEKDASIMAAKQALEESATAVHAMLSKALHGDGKVSGFKPDAWSFVAYLVAHEAHHRGQMLLLARQLGHPVDKSTIFGLWQWGVR